MASTRLSLYIYPGRRAGNIKQIINTVNGSGITHTYTECACPTPINNKLIKNSNPDVIPASTQTARAVNAIRYSRGGKTVYGNAAYNSSGDAKLLGRVEGYEPPIKNRF